VDLRGGRVRMVKSGAMVHLILGARTVSCGYHEIIPIADGFEVRTGAKKGRLDRRGRVVS
jgi:hypothetical protein